MKWIKLLIIVFIGIMIEQGFLDLFEREENERERRAKAVVVVMLLVIETMIIFSGEVI